MSDKKTYNFISGLPRSGSTLLCNLLVQNPAFHSSPTSTLLNLLLGIRDRASDVQQGVVKANDDKEMVNRVLKGMFYGYFSHTDKKVCFDKSRGWCHHIEMAEEILGHPIKILVTVRDVREVLASFEKLWKENAGHRTIPQERADYHQFNSVEGRLAMWMKPNQVVGASYNNIRDAVQRGFANRLYFIDFDAFTEDPEKTMRGIYEFLGEKYYKHDFDNIEQVIQEKDEYYGFDDLHTIRPKIEPVMMKWPISLGEQATAMYSKMNFWEDAHARRQNGLKSNLDL